MINTVDSISNFDVTKTDTTFKAATVLKADFMRFEKELPKSKKVDWLNIDKILRPDLTQSSSEKIKNQKIYHYAPTRIKTIRDEKIKEEQNHISNTVTSRTAFNTKQLKCCGVKNRDIIKYLTYDGHVTDDGKKILQAHGKTYR